MPTKEKCDCGYAPVAPKTLEEFEKRLFRDPVAYAYYNMGRAVERDKALSPEQQTRKSMNEIFNAMQAMSPEVQAALNGRKA